MQHTHFEQMGDRYRDELCLIHDLCLFRLRGPLLTQLQSIITTVQEKKGVYDSSAINGTFLEKI